MEKISKGQIKVKDIPCEFFVRDKPVDPPKLTITVYALTKENSQNTDKPDGALQGKMFLPVYSFTTPELDGLCSASDEKDLYQEPLVLMVELELNH